MRLVLALGVVSAVLVCPSGTAVADGVEQDCQNIAAQDPNHYDTSRPSLPVQEMGVDDALARLRQEHVKPGAGVTVAVVDSGVAAAAPVHIAGRVDAGNRQPEPLDYHGTAVAGLIAGAPRSHADGGAVGMAPAARILDVQVYDEASASAGVGSAGSPLTVDNVRQGLAAVIAAVPTLGIRIVNLSLAIPDDDQVRAEIAQLWSLGVIVVAPTGNRSTEPVPGLPSSFSSPRSGEDAAPYVHPADYDHVLGVNATPEGSSNSDPTHWVLSSSATDVAAPTAGAVSYSLRGEPCLLVDPATSYAAAEVSGVLALMQSAYHEPIAASVRRLLTTADGPSDVPNPLVGAGVVDASDALTRPMGVDSAGTVRHQPQVLAVPPDPKDVLATTRHDAVWWGLAGGGVLLLAAVLRPLLARRRY